MRSTPASLRGGREVLGGQPVAVGEAVDARLHRVDEVVRGGAAVERTGERLALQQVPLGHLDAVDGREPGRRRARARAPARPSARSRSISRPPMYPVAPVTSSMPLLSRLMPSAPQPVNVLEYERLAEGMLEEGALGYFAGGACDERTLRENVAAFGGLRLRPRMLVDVSNVSAATTVLGTEVSMPLLVAPTAIQKMCHPDGEAATARAAAAVGTVMTLSTIATATPAEVAAGGAGRAALVPALLLRGRGRDARAGRPGRRARLLGDRPDRRRARAPAGASATCEPASRCPRGSRSRASPPRSGTRRR